MIQYISKSDLITEIERRIKEIDETGTYLSPKGILTNLLCHIDTLEVKEVDLEKELKCLIGNVGQCDRKIARHFFELGLKTKGD